MAAAAALCHKSGNAAILRGGSESLRSAGAIHACVVQGLREAGLPEDAVQAAPTADRAFVGAMLGASGLLDLIVDRKSTRLNSSHANISYAVFCLKKKKYKRTYR